MLGISEEESEKAIDLLAEKKGAVCDIIRGKEFIFLSEMYRAEKDCAKQLIFRKDFAVSGSFTTDEKIQQTEIISGICYNDVQKRAIRTAVDKGILVPLTVRPVPEGDYEIISGHRRKHAAEIAGLTTVPAIIRDLSDEDAVDIMIYSNIQRTNILPSEKANAYRLQIANFAVYNFLLIKFVQINTVSQVIRSIPFICSTCKTIIKMREMLLYSKRTG